MCVFALKYGWYDSPKIETHECDTEKCDDAYHACLSILGRILCQDYDWVDFYRNGIFVYNIYDRLQDYHATTFDA